MQLAIYTALLLSFIGSSLAYFVNAPNGNQGIDWKGHLNPQRVAWDRVDTDPTSFDIVLTRQQPPFHQTIAQNVDGTRPYTIVYPPSHSGFPTGSNFRVNLQTKEGAILAQSNEFSIKF